jgi:MASE9 protein
MDRNTRLTQIFIGSMVLAAVASLTYAGLHSHTLHLVQATALLALAAATSKMKVKLPGITGNMSVNLPFLLIAAISLSAVEATAIACLSTVLQSLPKPGNKFKPEQMVFNVSMMGLAASLASLLWHATSQIRAAWASEPVLLVLTTAVFFAGQTVPVAAILTLTESTAMRRTGFRNTWLNIAQLSFPYYVVSAGVAAITASVSHTIGWQTALAVFPVMYAIHRSYRLYFANAAETPRLAPLSRVARAGM